MSSDLPETPDAAATDEESEFIDDGVLYDDDVTPEYGVLGFTIRELAIVGVWVIHFALSFFPTSAGGSLWSTGIAWLLPVGVPTVAVFLLVLRRFSPDGIRRVGSLGIDQFASVAASVAATVMVGSLWLSVSTLIGTGIWLLSWSGILLTVTSLALVVLTVFAPIIPGLREDFHGRLVTLAHRNANPVRPVIARPRPEAPVAAVVDAPEQAQTDAEPSVPFASPDATARADGFAFPVTQLDVELSGDQATDEVARLDLAEQVPLAAHASGGDTGTAQATADEEYTPTYSRRSRGEEIVSDTASIIDLVTPDPDPEPEVEPDTDTHITVVDPLAGDIDVEATNPRDAVVEAQPFWILAPTEREVHDELGAPLFRIGPNAWALVIEDRGGAFVVRHDDGRIGYLHDISDITRG